MAESPALQLEGTPRDRHVSSPSLKGGPAPHQSTSQKSPLQQLIKITDDFYLFSMSSSASGAALATEVLAAQKLYYNVVPDSVVAVLLLFSSQLLGYGMAGVLRKSLVYPTKMLWPSVLPLSSLIETLHRERNEMKKRFRFFCMFSLPFSRTPTPFLSSLSTALTSIDRDRFHDCRRLGTLPSVRDADSYWHLRVLLGEPKQPCLYEPFRWCCW